LQSCMHEPSQPGFIIDVVILSICCRFAVAPRAEQQSGKQVGGQISFASPKLLSCAVARDAFATI
jgi:hypothetical protein